MVASRRIFALAVLTLGASAASPFARTAARCDDVSDFCAGRTVQLVIGYATGGGYDDYARLLGRHIGLHIPGNPTVVVQNMPGAGSIRAANYLHNVAPKHGSVFGGFARDRKSTRLNSSHANTSYAVFRLNKKYASCPKQALANPKTAP